MALVRPGLPLRVSLRLLSALKHIGTESAAQTLMTAIEADERSFGLRGYSLLGDMRDSAKVVLPRLHKQLELHRKVIRDWRDQRDRPAQKGQVPAVRPSGYLIFELALTLSRLETDQRAIQFLDDDLADVREAAALGLAMRLRVSLLEELQRRRQQRSLRDPLFRHAAFRAIDQGLRLMEQYGRKDDLAALQGFRARSSDPAVLDRIDYTLTELSGRLKDEAEDE